MRPHGNHGNGKYFSRRAQNFFSWTTDQCINKGFLPYRSRSGILMGVCKGIALHFDYSPATIRFLIVMLFLFTGFWPVGILYILAGLFMKLEPAISLKDEQDKEFYQAYEASRETAINRVKRKFDNIERRIQRIEETVISRDFEL